MLNIIGIVVGKQERQSARGNRFAFVQFSDPAGSFEVTVFSDVLERSREMFEIGQILVLLCEIKIEGEQIKILLKGVQDIEKIIEKSDGNGFRIFIESIEAVNALVDRLGNLPPKHNGNKVPLNLVVVDKNLQGDVEIKLAEAYSVNPDLIGAIKHIDGVVHVERMS
jgi:DNA polymerase-3 subunit alpha